VPYLAAISIKATSPYSVLALKAKVARQVEIRLPLIPTCELGNWPLLGFAAEKLFHHPSVHV